MSSLVVHYAALGVIGVSVVGSTLVILSTIYRGKYKTIGDKLSMIMLLNIMAASMFLTVYRGWALSYGKGDWILFVLTFGAPVIHTSIGWVVGTFGPDAYWCFLNPNVSAGRLFLAIGLAVSVLCIALPAVCYYLIYRKIAETNRDLAVINCNAWNSLDEGMRKQICSTPGNAFSDENGRATSANTSDAVTVKTRLIIEKLLQYELVLIITFSSLIVYSAMVTLRKPMDVWVAVLVVVCFNSCGWLNAAVFLYQDWRKRGEGLMV
ncbi:hypothetical protein HDU67_006004 [Dinochytrium kinnereticum]|nr:hypothetical protein HDU67_006004 [Dinochytrium kinnereticum]